MPISGTITPVPQFLPKFLHWRRCGLRRLLYDNKVMLTGGILDWCGGNTADHPYVQSHEPFPEKCTHRFLSALGNQQPQAGTWNRALRDQPQRCSHGDELRQQSNDRSGCRLAVAQAQHLSTNWRKLLAEKGFRSANTIHPVAGRMPRRYSVLLAKADMVTTSSWKWNRPMMNLRPPMCVDTGGPMMWWTPAKTDPSSNLRHADTGCWTGQSGDRKQARHRNPVTPVKTTFLSAKTSMLFGDAKKVLPDLCAEIKSAWQLLLTVMKKQHFCLSLLLLAPSSAQNILLNPVRRISKNNCTEYPHGLQPGSMVLVPKIYWWMPVTLRNPRQAAMYCWSCWTMLPDRRNRWYIRC